MVLGQWLEMRAISEARGALDALAALLPDTAERTNGTGTRSRPVYELRAYDLVLVRPGARVPADGTVVDGSADVDESMITGESKAVSKMAGARVVGGTAASGGSLRVGITAIGDETSLSLESCDSSPLRKLPAFACKLMLTVQLRSFFMRPSRLAQL